MRLGSVSSIYQCILFFPRSMRLAGYRQLTWCTYNRLGKGNRRVIPSCVAASIRSNYPDAAGNYTGFKDAEDNDPWPG